MPFYIRKSISVGPLRFNISKSGIGISAGVRGLRIGSGARGNYIHAGREGIYYRKTVPGQPIGSATVFKDLAERVVPPSLESKASHPHLADADMPQVTEFESGSALRMVDATAEELLGDLNATRKRTNSWPWIAGATIVVLAGIGVTGVNNWVGITAAVVGAALTFWCYQKDEAGRYVVSMYELDEEIEKPYRDLCAAFEDLAASSGVWHISSEQSATNAKRSGGATSTVQRKSISPNVGGGPKNLKTNISVPMLPVEQQNLFFLPDRILVEAPEGYGAIRYSELSISTSKERFVESGELTKGAEIVGKTWMYVNKSGEPDQRFKDNREIPIVIYERLHLRSPSGLNELIQLAQPENSRRLQQALRELA